MKNLLSPNSIFDVSADLLKEAQNVSKVEQVPFRAKELSFDYQLNNNKIQAAIDAAVAALSPKVKSALIGQTLIIKGRQITVKEAAAVWDVENSKLTYIVSDGRTSFYLDNDSSGIVHNVDAIYNKGQ